MKKTILFISAIIASTALFAEGYQVNNLSTKQLGMGYVGAGMKLNSESIWFNPAAAAYQPTTFDFSVGVAGIASYFGYKEIDYTGKGASAKSDNKLSTPFYAYMNYKPTQDLSVGLSVTTPFGSAMKWNDNWVGAHLIQSIELMCFQFQPTVSYKFLDGRLSVGAGFTISMGNFNLSRSLLKVGSSTNNTIAYLLQNNGMGQYAPAITAVGDNPLVSAKLKSDSKIAFGVNIGIMYDINDQWSLGVNYHSKTKMKVEEGTAELVYANENVKQILGATGLIPSLDQGTFSTSLPLPATFTIGTSFRPYEKWEFAMDIQWVGWKAYKNLNVTFNEKELGIDDINSFKNYKNTLITRLGLQFFATEWFTFRTGMYVDESPVRSTHMNPETPSMTKLAFTGGISLMPGKHKRFAVNLTYGYIKSADPERAGSYPYANALNGGAIETFAGNYTFHAHTASFGLSYKF